MGMICIEHFANFHSRIFYVFNHQGVKHIWLLFSCPLFAYFMFQKTHYGILSFPIAAFIGIAHIIHTSLL